MQLSCRLLLSSLAAVILSVPLAGMAFAHPVNVIHGCLSGDVCMYTVSGYNSDNPEHQWYHYSCYNLSNEYGERIIVNNQTGGATATVYGKYSCAGPGTTLSAGSTTDGDIGDIDSISLNRP